MPLDERKNRYPIFKTSTQCRDTSSGGYYRDWALFEFGKNEYGQFPIENQKSFFRPAALANFPPAKTSSVRVTGFGGTKDEYTITQQTATGEFLGSFSPFFNSSGFFNLRLLVYMEGGISGSPVFLNGTSLALGIADSGTKLYSSATSLQDSELAEALHAFPGAALNPVIRGENIFYVDYEAPFALKANGNLFKPFATLTEAFNQIEKVGRNTDTIVSVVTGSYPEKIRQNDLHRRDNPADITVILPVDATLTLVFPVGSVAIWAKAGAPPE